MIKLLSVYIVFHSIIFIFYAPHLAVKRISSKVKRYDKELNPADMQRWNNIASTLIQRQDVESMLNRRCFAGKVSDYLGELRYIQRSISYQTASASSENSGQPAYPLGLIRVFATPCDKPRIQSVIRRTAKTDQTARMLKLIRVFAGRTCNLIENAMSWLILLLNYRQLQ